ncbi:lipid II:glycine glycyltransferase FemX [Rhodococcus sp. NPDC127528]|uniref:lipid II:glycine glycyltransferase FemX n=1 Tax=unclassified Rhodococcus (in: high G+C Gram-positive bacteria) TaxID=192944 RepID=UPI00363A7FE0
MSERDSGRDVVVVRTATTTQIERWDAFVVAASDGGDVWRGLDNAKAKESIGYSIRYLMVGDDAVTVHVKDVPVLGEMWILPGGPSGKTLDEVLPKVRALAAYAAEHGAFVLRIDPRVQAGAGVEERLCAEGYRPAGMFTPNKHTVVLDLTGTEDEILAGFSKNARRAIKRAARDGVEIERVPATDANCDTMYDLLSATGNGRFGVRSREYCRSAYQGYADRGNGQMFFARLGGEIVAGSFEIRLGTKSLGLHGGSIRKKPGDATTNGLGSHGTGHALQWDVLRWAMESGAVEYDMCGTPPSAEADDPDNYFYGIGKFKRSFRDEIIDYVGAYDVPLNSWKSTVWAGGLERECKRFSMLVRGKHFL